MIMECKVTVRKSHYPKEVPFEVPEGWVWTTLDGICSIRGGKRIPKGKSFAAERTQHVYIRVTDMKDQSIDMSDLKYIDDEVYNEISRYIIEKEDLYLTIAGTIGRVGEIPTELHRMNLTENAARLTDIVCNKKYLMYALLTDVAQNHFSLRFHQVAQPKLSIETASSTPIALPPPPEQERIVEAIQTWLSCIHRIEENQDDLKAMGEKAKAQILNLAIHGKLVRQDPSDEPAIGILRRINPSFTPSDNLHYVECPNGWAVTQMKSIIDLLSGRDLENSRCNTEGYGVPYLVGASCIDNDCINIYRWTETPEVISKEGDVLLSCKGTVGEVVLNTFGTLHIARQFMAIRSKAPQYILPDYLVIFIKASIDTLKKAARGIIPGISREDILELTVMIPPIEEQQRILSRIVELNQSVSQIVANTCD